MKLVLNVTIATQASWVMMTASNGKIFRVSGPLCGEFTGPISSNIAWLIQWHDTIQMKSNFTWIIFDNDNIAIRSHIMISVWNLMFGTKFSSISVSKGEKRLVFHLLTCSVRKMVLICLMQNIDTYLLYKLHQLARLVTHLINHVSRWMFTVWQENATKFGSKN